MSHVQYRYYTTNNKGYGRPVVTHARTHTDEPHWMTDDLVGITSNYVNRIFRISEITSKGTQETVMVINWSCLCILQPMRPWGQIYNLYTMKKIKKTVSPGTPLEQSWKFYHSQNHKHPFSNRQNSAEIYYHDYIPVSLTFVYTLFSMFSILHHVYWAAENAKDASSKQYFF